MKDICFILQRKKTSYFEVFNVFSFLFPRTMINTAIVIAKIVTAAPVSESINCLKPESFPVLNVVIMAVSKFSIETDAAISEIALAVE